jgi:hypothetical protein
MALPVAVFEDDDDEEDDEDEEDEDDCAGVEVVVVVVGVAVGARECGLNPSAAARPAAVAVRTIGARFMVRRRRTRGGGAWPARPRR